MAAGRFLNLGQKKNKVPSSLFCYRLILATFNGGYARTRKAIGALFPAVQSLMIVLRQRVDDGNDKINYHCHYQLFKERSQYATTLGGLFAFLAVKFRFLALE